VVNDRDLGVVFTNDGHGAHDLRVSLKFFETGDERPSFYSRLPPKFQREIDELLNKIFGAAVAATIDRIELSIYSRGKALHGGSQTLQRLCLRLHRDGDLKLAMCGPFARMCVFGCCVGASACVRVDRRV
jgi:hypothetical protein